MNKQMDELNVAIDAVRKAGELCQSVQAALVSESTLAKKDKSPVTVADFGAQALIIAALRESLGDVRIMAEENADELRLPENETLRKMVVEQVQGIHDGLDEQSILSLIDHGGDEGGEHGVFWTLDPIDGTKGFLRGGQYALALARIENGNITIGVLGCPNLPVDLHQSQSETGCLLYAVRSQGATMEGWTSRQRQAVETAPTVDVSEAILCESVESGHSAHDDSKKLMEHLNIQREPLRMDSQCKYAAVARGDATLYLRFPTRSDYQEKVWDHAAGSIVIQEAGGNVCDIDGRPLDFTQGRTLAQNRGIIATNGALQMDVIDAVRQILDYA